MARDQETIPERGGVLEDSAGVDGALERAAMDRVRARMVGAPAEPPSLRVGRYLIVSELGRGAMGRVLEAYDPKLHRVVALKVLLAAAMTDRARARLVNEARAMARLNHPNVVEVYDVHVEKASQVVVAMELVRGPTLSNWLAESDRSYAEIIETFVSAARGLAAAHDAGLLHRDFKPANVLIAHEHTTGRETAKVTDFGLARDAGDDDKENAAERGSSSSSELDQLAVNDQTTVGQVLGTPRYMAPEQHGAEPLDPAADQYAFCVALWRALAGKPPFAGNTVAELALQKYKGPPEWPGGRDGMTVPRSTVLALERGLALHPKQRWPDMRTLADALQPTPPSRKRWWLLGAAAAVAGVIAAGTTHEDTAPPCSSAASHIDSFWNDEARATVESQLLASKASYGPGLWSKTKAHLDAYAGAWVTRHTETCKATTVRKEVPAEVMDLRMRCLERSRIAFEGAVAVLREADPTTARNAHRIYAALPNLERCDDVESLRTGVPAPPSEIASDVATLRRQLAEAAALRRARNTKAASATIDEAELRAVDLHYPPVQTELALERAEVARVNEDTEGALVAFAESGRRALAQRDPATAATSHIQLAFVRGIRQARFDEADAHMAVAHAILADRRGLDYEWARYEFVMSTLLREMGRPREALEHGRRALDLVTASAGTQDIAVARAHSGLGNSLSEIGEVDAARVEYEAALETIRHWLGADHPDMADIHMNFGAMLHEQNQVEDAMENFETAARILEDAGIEDDAAVPMLRGNIGTMKLAQQEFVEAERWLRRAVESSRQFYGPGHPQVGLIRSNLAAALIAQDRIEEAETEISETFEAVERTVGEDSPRLAPILVRRAQLHELRGDRRAAASDLRRAIRMAERSLGSDHPQTQFLRRRLAAVR